VKKLRAMDDIERNGAGEHPGPRVETLVFILPEFFTIPSLLISASSLRFPWEETYQFLFSKDDFRPPCLPYAPSVGGIILFPQC